MCVPIRCATAQMVSSGAASTCCPSSSKMVPGFSRFLALIRPVGTTAAWPPDLAPWEYVPPAAGLALEVGPPASWPVGARTVLGACGALRSMGLLLMIDLLRCNQAGGREQLREETNNAGQRIGCRLTQSANGRISH